MLSKHRPGAEGLQEGWLNIYRLESAPFITQTSLHTSQEEADKFKNFMIKTPNDHRFVSQIRIEWVEE